MPSTATALSRECEETDNPPLHFWMAFFIVINAERKRREGKGEGRVKGALGSHLTRGL